MKLEETRLRLRKSSLFNKYLNFLSNMRPAPKATTLYILVHASDSIPPVRYIVHSEVLHALLNTRPYMSHLKDKIKRPA